MKHHDGTVYDLAESDIIYNYLKLWIQKAKSRTAMPASSGQNP